MKKQRDFVNTLEDQEKFISVGVVGALMKTDCTIFIRHEEMIGDAFFLFRLQVALDS
jgi:hypothetical protein